jgi:hypothetical protein
VPKGHKQGCFEDFVNEARAKLACRRNTLR